MAFCASYRNFHLVFVAACAALALQPVAAEPAGDTPCRSGIAVTRFADGSRLTARCVKDGAGSRARYVSATGRVVVGRLILAERDPYGPQMPDYPVLSRRLHEKGTALVAFTVAADGRVLDVGLVRSSGSDRLDAAALAAAAAWRYAPATVGGHPVASRVSVPVVFDKTFEEINMTNDLPIQVTPLPRERSRSPSSAPAPGSPR